MGGGVNTVQAGFLEKATCCRGPQSAPAVEGIFLFGGWGSGVSSGSNSLSCARGLGTLPCLVRADGFSNDSWGGRRTRRYLDISRDFSCFENKNTKIPPTPPPKTSFSLRPAPESACFGRRSRGSKSLCVLGGGALPFCSGRSRAGRTDPSSPGGASWSRRRSLSSASPLPLVVPPRLQIQPPCSSPSPPDPPRPPGFN